MADDWNDEFNWGGDDTSNNASADLWGNTSDSGGDNGFGMDDTSSGNMGMSDNSMEPVSLKTKLGQKAKLLVLVGIGTVLLIVLALVFGGDEEEEPAKQPEQTTTTTQQPAKTTSSGEWKDLTGLTIEQGEKIDSTFTVIEVHVYGRNTSGKIAPYELRAELIGALDGVDGSYKLIIPYKAASKVEAGTRVKVSYRLGISDTSKIVYDLELR